MSDRAGWSAVSHFIRTRSLLKEKEDCGFFLREKWITCIVHDSVLTQSSLAAGRKRERGGGRDDVVMEGGDEERDEGMEGEGGRRRRDQ